MKAQDLRIGNLLRLTLKSGNGRSNVRSITVYDIVKIENNEGSFNYAPIPITEEWLIKLGFEVEYDEDGPGYTKRGEYDFYLDAHFDYHRTDGSWINVEYIHQLQNLYYALTGQELTIKEENNENN